MQHLKKWDGKELPEEDVYEAFYKDFYPLAINKEAGKLYQRLNYEKSGFSSGLKKTNRKIKKFEKVITKSSLWKLIKSGEM